MKYNIRYCKDNLLNATIIVFILNLLSSSNSITSELRSILTLLIDKLS